MVEKQVYKLELPKKKEFITPEQNTTKKKQIDNNVTKLDTGNNNIKKYKVKPIHNSIIYTKKLE